LGERRLRKVLAIPLEEVHKHFSLNTRQDVKIVAPEILAGELIAKLAGAGKVLKPERPLNGLEWQHSTSDAANQLCESAEFADELSKELLGPFALGFANEKTPQDVHYHPHHLEIYYSEHPLDAEYRIGDDGIVEHLKLPHGGVLFLPPAWPIALDWAAPPWSLRFPR
jgi:hypothetical protein